MRLETITIKNFGRHRETFIDLRPITSATVCGANGDGKSTGFVLAPLWNLFKKCGTNPDAWIRLGETDTSVELTFRLNGQRYRSSRSRSIRTKKGKSNHQLCVELDDGSWQPLSTPMEKLLQADYDAISMANFWLQGKLDDFSRAQPADRKTVVYEVAGVTRFADYAERARTGGRTAEAKLTTLLETITRLEADVSLHTMATLALTNLDAEYLQLQNQEHTLSETQMARIQQKSTAEATLATMGEDPLPALTAQQVTIDGAVARLSSKKEELSQLVVKEPALLAKQAELKTTQDALAQVKHDRHAMGERYHKTDQSYQDLQARQTELHKTESGLKAQQAKLDTEIAHLTARITEYEGVIARAGERETTLQHLRNLEEAKSALLDAQEASALEMKRIEADCQQAQAALDTINATVAQAAHKRQGAQMEATQWVDRYILKTNMLQTEIEQAERKAALLQTVPCTADLQRQCGFTKDAIEAKEVALPALRQQLAERATDQEHIWAMVPYDLGFFKQAEQDSLKQMTQQKATLESLWTKRSQEQAVAERVKGDVKRLDGQITETRQSLPDATYLEQAHASLPGLKEKAAETETAWLTCMADLAAAQQLLTALPLDSTKAERLDLLSRLHELDARMEQTQHQLSVLLNALAELPAVQHAKATLPEVEQDLAHKLAERADLQAAIQRAQTHANQKQECATTIRTLTEAMQAGQQELARLKSALDVVVKRNAEQQAILSATHEAPQALTDAMKTRDRLKADIEEYSWLDEAYQRIPMMMLENAMPLVEREANRVLEIMSATGMTVAIRTQRPLKNVDALKDEITIIVRDDVGEHTYETYSGGEKTLIDAALRIGLSKLSAQRCGTKIETLVIDEAFGQLDPAAVDRARRYFEQVATEYPLLLVITHNETLKDALAGKITVTRTPDGPVVEVAA